ncbi:DNA primase [Altererythrobacter sp. TH136]|uniref:DNA primase n=1 Tax=Altererythrobacter sp. TH136 TaxID=2067415 RepID=UPI001161F6B5|nr:DNA primase [Altererythrobacter sp. TH136]QDM39885.1 DNA primase [Altererythrobacter sp. TH136]
MALSPQWLDELRARITLSTVVMRTTKLQRAGREWKACCPFHDEKSPSFYVNDAKGFYHCFGCGVHGDAIRWMTDQRGMSFMDAVKELAGEAGLEVPAPDPRAAQRAEQQAGLHEVTQAAQDWFRASLDTPAGAKAREYLASRDFDAHTLERFGFGYAPNARNAIGGALKQFDRAMLIEAGLLIAVDEKEPYDRFRDRLTIPIHDPRGRVIGFAARILDADKKDAPKYLNSPDTPLFDKGRTLFNLHRAGPASRKSGRIVVVEGQMDAVAMAAAGFEDAVAPMGTALTERQLEMLWRLADAPILCFDGDNAGQRAAMRAISRALPMLSPAKTLSIVQLPPGLDPDDLIRQQGPQAMEALLAAPASLIDTLWAFEQTAAPLRTPEDKAGLQARLMVHCDAIEQPDIKALYRRELLEKFSAFAFPPRPPRAAREKREWKGGFIKAANPQLDPVVAGRLRQAADGGSRDLLASAVIAGLLRFPDQILAHAEPLARFASSDGRSGPALETLIEAAEMLEPGHATPISAPQGFAPPPDKSRFAFLDEGADPQDAREDLAEAVSLLVERPALEAALAVATARFETEPEAAFAEQQRLLKRKLAFEKRLGLMASRRAARAAQPEIDSPVADPGIPDEN